MIPWCRIEAPIKVVAKYYVFSVAAIFFICNCGWNTTWRWQRIRQRLTSSAWVTSWNYTYQSIKGWLGVYTDSYSNLSGLVNQPAAKQVQALSLCFSGETLAIEQNLGLNDTAWGNAA